MEFKHPHELDAILRENMEISREGVDDETLLKASKDFIKYSVKTGEAKMLTERQEIVLT